MTKKSQIADDPYLLLAAKIVERAVYDASGTDYPARLFLQECPQGANEAREWLATTGVEWIDILGLDGEILHSRFTKDKK